MNILGISAFYHDSAACLVQDGTIVAAAQEERFTRKKHDHRFPQRAVEYCLEAGGVTADLIHAAFDLSSSIPTIGASGAISAVLGFYIVLFPQNRIRIFYWFFWIIIFCSLNRFNCFHSRYFCF